MCPNHSTPTSWIKCTRSNRKPLTELTVRLEAKELKALKELKVDLVEVLDKSRCQCHTFQWVRWARWAKWAWVKWTQWCLCPSTRRLSSMKTSSRFSLLVRTIEILCFMMIKVVPSILASPAKTTTAWCLPLERKFCTFSHASQNRNSSKLMMALIFKRKLLLKRKFFKFRNPEELYFHLSLLLLPLRKQQLQQLNLLLLLENQPWRTKIRASSRSSPQTKTLFGRRLKILRELFSRARKLLQPRRLLLTKIK